MDDSDTRSQRFGLFASTFLVAICSILYQLTIAQTLSLLAANTVIWYSVTVGLFLLGMGFGSFLSEKLCKTNPPWNALIYVETLLCLVGSLSSPLIHIGHTVTGYEMLSTTSVFAVFPFFGGAFLLTILIGILTGIELPLLMRIGKSLSNDPQITYRILGIDYIGSLVGAVVFPLFLVPHLEVITIGFTVAVLNISVALFLNWKRRNKRLPMFIRAGIAVLLAAGVVLALLNSDSINKYFIRKYYYLTELAYGGGLKDVFTFEKKFPDVFRASSPYQKIDLMEDPAVDPSKDFIDAYSTKFIENPDYPKKNILFLNGDFQLTSSYEEIYHEYFAHVPIIASGKVPKKVLLLGGGDGLLARELVKYEEIESITHVDLDKTLVELANTHPILSKMNEGSFQDPRVTTIFGDAYQYVRRSEEKFDAIYIDFPMPADYDLAKLYSREFFHFTRERIKEDGYVVFDATGTGYLSGPDRQGGQVVNSDNDWPYYYATLKAAGFPEIQPYITTLELDNPVVDEILSRPDTNLILSPEVMQMFEFVNTPAEEQAVTDAVVRLAKHNMVADHIMPLQQGFILLGNMIGGFSGEFGDGPGVPLHILNEKRYELAFLVDFPKPKEIDEDKLNSIMRPTFPTLPLWQPRTAF